MNKWNYGGFAEKYIMTGDIHIGTGTVRVHDIFDPTPDFMKFADIVFVDPPCSKGNMRSFYTKAGMDMTDEYEDFERRLWEVIDEIAPTAVYMEVFASNFDTHVKAMQSRFKQFACCASTYYHKAANQCWIIAGSNDDDFLTPQQVMASAKSIDEEDFIEALCMMLPKEKTIADPCMGRGLVGFFAHKYDKRFFGTELNVHRLAVLLERINEGKLKV